jgi:hypothetical protein
VKLGLITLDEYFKLREENIGGMSDSEDEKKELSKIQQELSKYSKKGNSRGSEERMILPHTF